MAKKPSGFLFLITFATLLFSCDPCRKYKGIIGSPSPYQVELHNEVAFKDKSKKKQVKITLKNSNNITHGFGIRAYAKENEFPKDGISQTYYAAIPYASDSSALLKYTKNIGFLSFTVEFWPYGIGNEKDIGREVSFVYEVYINDSLITKKDIFVKADYSKNINHCIHGEKHPWLLDLEKLDISNKEHVKEINTANRGITLRFELP